MINPLSTALLTEEELNLPYEHTGEYFTFKCKVGITLETVEVTQKYIHVGSTTEMLMKDITSFIGMWTINYYNRMPGFIGFGGIKYKINY